MENKDLNDKKINNEQEVNEGFSGENIPETYNPAEKLKPETETDRDGNEETVRRARNTDGNTNNNNTTQDTSRNADFKNEKTVENKDRNSDITPNRYPNAHPDNHENRGNISLDEK